MPDVFISYNREDQHRAQGIADALKAEGLGVWWDSHLRAGESYDEVTEANLRSAGAVVVLWSKRSANSKWVRAEATIGERCSTLVPAMIEECERPLRFELVQTADLSHWHGDRNDSRWRAFVQDIKNAIGHQESPAASAPTEATQAPAEDVTIENTFWTSIKDGNDRSDFDAYLKRYPNGHFADLARNRIAALDRAAQAPARSAPPAPTQQTAPPRATAPQPRPAAPQPQARVPQPAQRPQTAQAAPAPSKSGGGMGVILIGAVALIALAAAGFFFLQKNGASDDAKIADATNTTSDTTSAATPPAPNAIVASQADTEPTTNDSEPASDLNPGDAVDDPSGDAALEETITPLTAADAVIDNGGDAAVAEEPNASVDTPEAATEDAAQTPETAAESNFSDCERCPQMTVLPAGTFKMGSPKDEPGRAAYEGPQREVSVPSFAIATHEVSFDEWAACVDDGGCGAYKPGDAGFGRGSRPVLSISWRDAKAYVKWLSKKTNRTYRLPTEAEWEYAARGGAETAYWWGAQFDRSMTTQGKTLEAGVSKPNGFGLFDMTGNAAEWVEDCYVNNYRAAPTDGGAVQDGDCGRRVVRGGSWKSDASELRIANRSRITSSIRDRSLGFRVVADID